MKKTLLLALAIILASLRTLPALAQWSSDPQLNTVVQDSVGTDEVVAHTASLPDGSTYASWFAAAPTVRYQMRLQRFDAAGNKLWGPNGILVSGTNINASTLYSYDLEVDQQGNALLGFQDLRAGGTSTQVVVYKISPAGKQLWGANGISLLDQGATLGLAPSITVTNSNNVVVSWNSSNSTGRWVASQKFAADGTALWSAVQRIQDPTGVIRYDRPAALPVGTDDILLTYVKATGSGTGVSLMFAQRYDATGAAVWAAPTQVSTQSIGFTFFPQPLADGAGGYFISFNSGNPANALLSDVYVQRVNSDGSLPWGTVGKAALAGTSTARFDGNLQYNKIRNELWLALTVTDTQQKQAGISFQKYDPATGATALGAVGVVVQPISAALYRAIGFRDTGSGLLLVYTEALSATNSAIKATKRTYTGAPAWASGVINVSSVASPKLQFDMGAFATGQVVLSWQDNRQDKGIYVQNVRDEGRLGAQVLATRPGLVAQPLALYPNPGLAPTLRLPLTQSQAVTLRLRDATGRLVLEQQVTLPAGSQEVPLRAEALAAGLYLVEASTATALWRGQWVKP